MKLLPASNEWHFTHTDLSRYLVTRLYQLVDTSEVISYRYPITNGMILVEELYDTATSCLQRPKTKDRLKSLLDECCNKDIQTSIVNDLIINDYFRQIISDIQDLRKLDVAKEEPRLIKRWIADFRSKTTVGVVDMAALLFLNVDEFLELYS